MFWLSWTQMMSNFFCCCSFPFLRINGLSVQLLQLGKPPEHLRKHGNAAYVTRRQQILVPHMPHIMCRWALTMTFM